MRILCVPLLWRTQRNNKLEEMGGDWTIRFPLSPNQIFSILTPRRAWTENLLTLYCACLILTQLSRNVYQVLSDGDE